MDFKVSDSSGFSEVAKNESSKIRNFSSGGIGNGLRSHTDGDVLENRGGERGAPQFRGENQQLPPSSSGVTPSNTGASSPSDNDENGNFGPTRKNEQPRSAGTAVLDEKIEHESSKPSQKDGKHKPPKSGLDGLFGEDYDEDYLYREFDRFWPRKEEEEQELPNLNYPNFGQWNPLYLGQLQKQQPNAQQPNPSAQPYTPQPNPQNYSLPHQQLLQGGAGAPGPGQHQRLNPGAQPHYTQQRSPQGWAPWPGQHQHPSAQPYTQQLNAQQQLPRGGAPSGQVQYQNPQGYSPLQQQYWRQQWLLQQQYLQQQTDPSAQPYTQQPNSQYYSPTQQQYLQQQQTDPNAQPPYTQQQPNPQNYSPTQQQFLQGGAPGLGQHQQPDPQRRNIGQ
ncbi:MAG: hypothetical protein LBR91_02230 [Puniceicoccales bacterium]|nr:hypothetical protein [Puniceicoccales bacterium]